VQRFLREGRTAVKIRNEHVARVMNVDRTADGRPYMVMEYLEGLDLGTLVRRRGPLEVVVAVDYVLQACEALAEAHALGIVHRDLKPANLFLATDRAGLPLIKVLDFGISKLNVHTPSPHDLSLTGTGAIFGSPLYMAPEQMRASRRVDARADLWALGATFFQLVTGKPPYQGETLTEIIAAILQDAPPSLRAHRPGVPPELEAVLTRCLERDVDRRYPSVSDFAQDLRAFASPAGLNSIDRILRTVAPTSMVLPVQGGSGSTRLALTGPESARLATAEGVRTDSVWSSESTRPLGTRKQLWAYAALGVALCAGSSVVALNTFRHRPARPLEAVHTKPPTSLAAHPPEAPAALTIPLASSLAARNAAAALLKPPVAPPAASATTPSRPPPRPRSTPPKPASTLANDRHG
jgi:eukaryotic-like serine/threonine-protein kinase